MLVDNVNVGVVGNYIFFNVTTNHTIRAVFAPSGLFTINASAGPERRDLTRRRHDRVLQRQPGVHDRAGSLLSRLERHRRR